MNKTEIEVTLAWLACDMSNGEVAKVLGINSVRNVYQKMASNMRELYRQGRIKRLKPLRVRGTIN